MPRADSHSMFPHTSSVQHFHLEIRNAIATATHVFIDTTFVRAATTPVHTHRSLMGIRPLRHKFRNQSTSQRSRFHSKKTRQGNGTPKLQLSHNIQLRSRVVGNQNVNHVLIRACHHSRTSSWVPSSQFVAHGNAEFIQTILGLVLRLVGLILISVLRTSPCASRQRHPKDSSPPLSTLLVNAEAPFNQLILVLRTLIIAWRSRHTRVVLLGLASCRALPGLLGQLTEHPARRLGLALDLAAL